MIIHIKDAGQFAEEIKEGKVLVDFFATWCGPCKMLTPIIEAVAEEHSSEIKVLKIDTDECPDIAMAYRVSAIPTLLLFQDGKLADRTMGYMAAPQLLAFAKLN